MTGSYNNVFGIDKAKDNNTYLVTLYRGQKMTEEEKEKYLDNWGTKCFICGKEVERKDMTLVGSIVEVEPRDGGPVTQYYLVCPDCVNKRELV